MQAVKMLYTDNCESDLNRRDPFRYIVTDSSKK